MSFQEELLKKKSALKKTEVVTNDKKQEQLIVKDSEDYDRLIKETYFEAYYDKIEEFTFKSVILPLTLEEIKSIHDAYTAFISKNGSHVDLNSIASKIEEGIKLIREKTGNDCKVFTRLSSRSPKDAIYHLEEFPGLYNEKLEQFDDKNGIFAKLFAFYQASTEIMAISSGNEATNLLRLSERIQGDLEYCLKNSEPMNLIVREFVNFPVKNELRGFVYKGIFTALTQYNNLIYLSEHIEVKDEVEKKVKKFVEKFIVAMKTTLDSFVIDIVTDEKGKVWVIEVNPFGELAGSCLFDWSKDRAILMGEKPFEFRIVDNPPSIGHIKSEIDQKVLDIMGVK